MFGFKKKQCAFCEARDVINVGGQIGHLCEKHVLDTYKTKFLAHQGKKVIVPPISPDKYTSYQFETIALLRSYGLDGNDVAPVEKLFSELRRSECYVMQSRYEAKDFLDIDAFENANWKQKSSNDAALYVLASLPSYMESNGIALPPDGDENIIIYPLRS